MLLENEHMNPEYFLQDAYKNHIHSLISKILPIQNNLITF